MSGTTQEALRRDRMGAELLPQLYPRHPQPSTGAAATGRRRRGGDGAARRAARRAAARGKDATWVTPDGVASLEIEYFPDRLTASQCRLVGHAGVTLQGKRPDAAEVDPMRWPPSFSFNAADPDAAAKTAELGQVLDFGLSLTCPRAAWWTVCFRARRAARVRA